MVAAWAIAPTSIINDDEALRGQIDALRWRLHHDVVPREGVEITGDVIIGVHAESEHEHAMRQAQADEWADEAGAPREPITWVCYLMVEAPCRPLATVAG